MKTATRTFMVAMLALLFVAPLSADDKKAKAKKGGKKPAARQAAGLPPYLKAALAKLDLNEDQKKQIAAIEKESGGMFAELRKAASAGLTAEQKKARAEAFKAAKADGKTGKDLQAAVKAALKLDPKQVEAAKKARADMQAFVAEVRGKVRNVLTDEQKKQFGGGKRGGAKKKKAE